jgi:hypothetical protein
LREEIPVESNDNAGVWFVELLNAGTEADTLVYLKYYADNVCRQGWLATFPDDVLPPHEDPPYDRDRHLPQPSGRRTE